VIGAPRKVLEIETPAEGFAYSAQDLDGFRGYVLPDTVTGDNRNSHEFFEPLNTRELPLRAKTSCADNIKRVFKLAGFWPFASSTCFGEFAPKHMAFIPSL
jgi:hypothetical protein